MDKFDYFGIRHFELKVVEDNEDEYLQLFKNGVNQGRWKLWTQEKPQLSAILNPDGTFKKDRSPTHHAYVYGGNGKRFRYLFFNISNRDIGTMFDLKIRYWSNCMSRKERTDNGVLKELRDKRKKQSERRARKAKRRLQMHLNGEKPVDKRTINAEKAKQRYYKKRQIEHEENMLVRRFNNNWRNQ
jgi:hypothetical protein